MSAPILVGTTGLVGSHILDLLSRGTVFPRVTAFVRRDKESLTVQKSTNFNNVDLIVEPNSANWARLMPPSHPVLFSALGTTRSIAGSFENQHKIDYDLNLELAHAAFNATPGSKIYVLISAQGADPNSWFNYPKMKGELERDVLKIGFEHTVILRPGMILGDRSAIREPGRMAESIASSLVRGIAYVAPSIGNGIANTAEDIATAAIAAAVHCKDGTRPDGKKGGRWVLGPKEINALAAESRRKMGVAESNPTHAL